MASSHLLENATTPASSDSASGETILKARGLRVRLGNGPAIVDGVDLSIRRGELVCLVGESGSGKSLTALALLRLLPSKGHVSAEQIIFRDQDLSAIQESAMQQLRGDRIAMIFQEPMTSLNPVMTIGFQITEALLRHRDITRSRARKQAVAMLKRVQIPAAEDRFAMYPHQLSGGMRQRVMIAMALVCRPALLIADEPTTALDVTIQNQILDLIDELRAEMETAVLFITHNLAVVAQIADTVAVMYAGRVVESGPRDAVFQDPQHPYTLALFAAMPRVSDQGRRLSSIEGQVPMAGTMPAGCRFAPRCAFATGRCQAEYPPIRAFGTDHVVACWRAPIEEAVDA